MVDRQWSRKKFWVFGQRRRGNDEGRGFCAGEIARRLRLPATSEEGRRLGRPTASEFLDDHGFVQKPSNRTTACYGPTRADDMVRGELTRPIWAAAESLLNAPRPRSMRMMRCPQRSIRPATRFVSTTPPRLVDLTRNPSEPAPEPFSAAPEIVFEEEGPHGGSDKRDKDKSEQRLLRTLRIVPASQSYFSAKPTFTDDFINLSALLRSVATLPTIPASEAPRVAWKTIDQYRIMTNEPVKNARYHRILQILKRLNCVHPTLMPEQVRTAMRRYMKDSQPGDIVPAPGIIDEWGRARGVGRRKTSSAVAWLVEGEGEVLVNGKSLSGYFGRLHHRESAVWALKATQRLDKYNVFGLVQGGGSTGQAEALTLAVAKALLVHEPALKPALRRGRFSQSSPLVPS